MGPTLSQKLRLFTKIYSRIFRGYHHSKYNFGTAAYTNIMKALIIQHGFSINVVAFLFLRLSEMKLRIIIFHGVFEFLKDGD